MSERYAMSIEEAVKYSGIGRTSLYELIKSGALPSTTVLRRRLILREDLEHLLRSGRTATRQSEVSGNLGSQ